MEEKPGGRKGRLEGKWPEDALAYFENERDNADSTQIAGFYQMAIDAIKEREKRVEVSPRIGRLRRELG